VNAIGRCDDPAATTDLGNSYRAYSVSRAYEPGALAARISLQGAVLRALPTSGVSITLTPIKDYGAETTPADATALLTATASERYVVKQVDDLRAGECTALQVRWGDPSARSVAAWSAERLSMNLTGAGRAA
jgi:hypothetical protein